MSIYLLNISLQQWLGFIGYGLIVVAVLAGIKVLPLGFKAHKTIAFTAVTFITLHLLIKLFNLF